ncbi:carboxylating nicotinate-nucleotide diphosphorylase [Candidatus Woesearchaeota archaeon]|nr:carboxylating nicotinate-nucleotide diphosphorylase [Candidatus Woesearchaeota archaeon]
MQHRLSQVLEFWDRSKKLSIKNKDYREFANEFLNALLKNDVKSNDLTTNSLANGSKNISALIIAKENGILAGAEEFLFINKDLDSRLFKKDGNKIKKGSVIAEINGNARKILSRERTLLNLLQRMSGIATLADSLNKKVKGKIKIAATRKTLWGLLDKKAVAVGHGLTHRLNLNDGVLIKDNHLKILDYDIEKALKLAKSSSKYIEIEAENKNQALKAAAIMKNLIGKGSKNMYAVMLDNIKPGEINSIINGLKKKGLYDYVLLEASGNITPKNLAEYEKCGADVASMGCITNSSGALNMSLEIK